MSNAKMTLLVSNTVKWQRRNYRQDVKVKYRKTVLTRIWKALVKKMHRFGTRGGRKASGQQSIPDCGKCPL